MHHAVVLTLCGVNADVGAFTVHQRHNDNGISVGAEHPPYVDGITASAWVRSTHPTLTTGARVLQ
jgi:hypothetical protein